MQYVEVRRGRTFLLRLDDGDDLLEAIGQLTVEENVISGYFTALGAMSRVPFAIYSLDKGRYEEIVKEGYYEFTSVVGNIALVLDSQGRPATTFVHGHITLADGEGRVFGGHLLRGSRAIALGEVHICETTAMAIVRLEEELMARGYSPMHFYPDVEPPIADGRKGIHYRRCHRSPHRRSAQGECILASPGAQVVENASSKHVQTARVGHSGPAEALLGHQVRAMLEYAIAPS